jgi:hypothetical protein
MNNYELKTNESVAHEWGNLLPKWIERSLIECWQLSLGEIGMKLLRSEYQQLKSEEVIHYRRSSIGDRTSITTRVVNVEELNLFSDDQVNVGERAERI